MAANRLGLRTTRPLIEPAATSRLERTVLLSGLRSAPWRASEDEARALQDGFAAADGFWSMLWCQRSDPAVSAVRPGVALRPLVGAGHAPQSDTPAAIVVLVRRATAAAAELVSPRA